MVDEVRHNTALHILIDEMSANPLLGRAAEPHWRFPQRAMGEILRCAKLPVETWCRNAEMVEAVVDGDVDRAERLVVSQDLQAAETLHDALIAQVSCKE